MRFFGSTLRNVWLLIMMQEEGDNTAEKERRKQELRKKIRVMAKMSRMYNTLCDEREAVMKVRISAWWYALCLVGISLTIEHGLVERSVRYGTIAAWVVVSRERRY